MTDKETLITYRLKQAQETLDDARKMISQQLSPRSITNRANYYMFYSVLALILTSDLRVKTSKHSGVISLFDREFIHKGNIAKHFSEILHKAFDVRCEGDYGDLVEITRDQALKPVQEAQEFYDCILQIIASQTIKSS